MPGPWGPSMSESNSQVATNKSLPEAVGQILQQVASITGGLSAYNASLQKLAEELKVSQGTLADLASIRDLSDTISEDVQALQTTISQSYDQIVGQSEAIMALLDTMQVVFDGQESFRNAVLGLTQQVHDQPCPWSLLGKDGELTPAERMEAIDSFLGLMPRIEIVVKDALDARGKVPSTGEDKWWGMRLMDQVKEAVVTVLLAVLAGMLLAPVAQNLLSYINPQATQETEQQHRLTERITSLEADLKSKDAALTETKEELAKVTRHNE